MADLRRTTHFRFSRRLIRFIGVIVPRRFRDRLRMLLKNPGFTLIAALTLLALGIALGLLGAIAILLATVALLACYLPARRATHVEPLVALRAE